MVINFKNVSILNDMPTPGPAPDGVKRFKIIAAWFQPIKIESPYPVFPEKNIMILLCFIYEPIMVFSMKKCTFIF